MKIDVVVSKLVKKGFTVNRAEVLASEIAQAAKTYGVNVYDLIDDITSDFKLNDLGEFITNNAVRQGYVVGRTNGTTANKYVSRAIIK